MKAQRIFELDHTSTAFGGSLAQNTRGSLSLKEAVGITLRANSKLIQSKSFIYTRSGHS